MRRRQPDIAQLANHFLDQFSRIHSRPRPRLTPGALDALTAYSWPGNIRELEAVMQRAILLAGPIIDAGALELNAAEPAPPPAEGAAPLRNTKAKLVETFERGYLVQLLRNFSGNISHAATAAGKERRTFQRLLKKHGLQGEDYRR